MGSRLDYQGLSLGQHSLGPSKRALGRVLRVLHVENPFCSGESGNEVEGRHSSQRVLLPELGAKRAAECFDGKDAGS